MDLFLSVVSAELMLPALAYKEWVLVVRVTRASSLNAVLTSSDFNAFLAKTSGRWGSFRR